MVWGSDFHQQTSHAYIGIIAFGACWTCWCNCYGSLLSSHVNSVVVVVVTQNMNCKSLIHDYYVLLFNFEIIKWKNSRCNGKEKFNRFASGSQIAHRRNDNVLPHHTIFTFHVQQLTVPFSSPCNPAVCLQCSATIQFQFNVYAREWSMPTWCNECNASSYSIRMLD